MLQEAFDLPSTQILSLNALASYLATRPQLTVSETAATTWRVLRKQTIPEYSHARMFAAPLSQQLSSVACQGFSC